uniref:Uncharacterized protein n=1 Tax=Rhizophora mucronata TaxID=61149 RepID=A0A2P2QXP2_RHIMU
MVLSLVSLAKT